MAKHTLKFLQHLLQDFLRVSDYLWALCINPFLANVPILYLWFFGVFRGYKMGTLATNRFNGEMIYFISSSNKC